MTNLFQQRISAWGHATDYLEDYVKATEKVEHSHVKEYEKVLKTVNHPLKEGHQFDQSVGGIAGMFENIRSNTQVIYFLSYLCNQHKSDKTRDSHSRTTKQQRPSSRRSCPSSSACLVRSRAAARRSRSRPAKVARPLTRHALPARSTLRSSVSTLLPSIARLERCPLTTTLTSCTAASTTA